MSDHVTLKNTLENKIFWLISFPLKVNICKGIKTHIYIWYEPKQYPFCHTILWNTLLSSPLQLPIPLVHNDLPLSPIRVPQFMFSTNWLLLSPWYSLQDSFNILMWFLTFQNPYIFIFSLKFLHPTLYSPDLLINTHLSIILIIIYIWNPVIFIC